MNNFESEKELVKFIEVNSVKMECDKGEYIYSQLLVILLWPVVTYMESRYDVIWILMNMQV